MIRPLLLATALLTVSGAAQAQQSPKDAIATAMGEITFLEAIEQACPGIYPDMMIVQDVMDRVFTYADQAYGGEQRSLAALNAPEMIRASDEAADRFVAEHVKKAGGPDKFCAYAASGAIKGLTKVSIEEQERLNPEP